MHSGPNQDSSGSSPRAELFEHLYDALILVDASGGLIEDLNMRAAQLVGLSISDLLGRPVERIFKSEAQSYHRGLLSRALRGERVLGECELLHATGVNLPVEIAYSPFRSGGRALVALTIRDLVERKRVDREREVVEMRRSEAQRLDSLNVLVGGVAHDFNNILMSILSYAVMGRDQGGQDPVMRRYFTQIESSTMRAGDLCRKMLAFAGRGEVSLKPGALNDLIGEVEPTLRSIVGGKAALLVHLSPDLPKCMLDRTRLPQVLVGMVQNALEALTREEKSIHVTTRLSYKDEPARVEGFFSPDMPRGDCLLIEVRDTGSGIPQERISRIFEPFFSTKFMGRGLGLSEALGIVRAHRGSIQVLSSFGQGSIFRIYLPLAPGFAEPQSLPQSQPPFPSSAMQKPLALVVDDLESNLEYVEHILKDCGFSVRTALDGRSALKCVEEYGSRLTLVVLDLSMPEMSGNDLLQRIRSSRHRDMRVVIMSGYSEEEVYERCYPFRPDGFLSKPFSSTELKKVVC